MHHIFDSHAESVATLNKCFCVIVAQVREAKAERISGRPANLRLM